MIRTRLSSLRHLVYALTALAIVVALGEVGLRIYDSYTGQITRYDVFDQGMAHRSWTTHHSMKPSGSFYLPKQDGSDGITIRTNSLGLRGEEVAVPKPPGVYRIVCLGDERTLAATVPAEDTFVGQLEGILQQYTRQRVEVLNAGVPGYCPLLSYLQLKHQLAVLQPDLLIVNFEMSDVADDYRYRRLTAMSADGMPLYCTHPKLLPAPETGASPNCEMLLLLQWGKRTATGLVAENIGDGEADNISAACARYAWLKDHPPEWATYIEKAMEPMLQCKILGRGLYADILVATGPVPWQVSPTASCSGDIREKVGVPVGTHCPSRRPFELLADYCRQHNIAFCDASPAFFADESPDALFQSDSLDYSSNGHRLYARELARHILRNSAGIWENLPSAGQRQPAVESTTRREMRSTAQ